MRKRKKRGKLWKRRRSPSRSRPLQNYPRQPHHNSLLALCQHPISRAPYLPNQYPQLPASLATFPSLPPTNPSLPPPPPPLNYIEILLLQRNPGPALDSHIHHATPVPSRTPTGPVERTLSNRSDASEIRRDPLANENGNGRLRPSEDSGVGVNPDLPRGERVGGWTATSRR